MRIGRACGARPPVTARKSHVSLRCPEEEEKKEKTKNEKKMRTLMQMQKQKQKQTRARVDRMEVRTMRLLPLPLLCLLLPASQPASQPVNCLATTQSVVQADLAGRDTGGAAARVQRGAS